MPRLAANLSMLFTEVPLPDRFRHAAEAGFQGVEIQFPYVEPPEKLAGLAQANGLELVMFNLPAGDWVLGERGLACLPGREDEFRAGLDQAIAYAKVTGVRMVNCLAGVAPPTSHRAVRETLVANLDRAARALGEHGLTLLVEPVNTRDVPGFYVSRTTQALGLIDDVGLPNIKLQYDVYHMQVMGEDPLAGIERHLDRIGHIQVADAPGRHEPGTGAIDFPRLLARLDALGWAGWVGCEYRPQAGTRDGLGWARNWLTGKG